MERTKLLPDARKSLWPWPSEAQSREGSVEPRQGDWIWEGHRQQCRCPDTGQLPSPSTPFAEAQASLVPLEQQCAWPALRSNGAMSSDDLLSTAADSAHG